MKTYTNCFVMLSYHQVHSLNLGSNNDAPGLSLKGIIPLPFHLNIIGDIKEKRLLGSRWIWGCLSSKLFIKMSIHHHNGSHEVLKQWVWYVG